MKEITETGGGTITRSGCYVRNSLEIYNNREKEQSRRYQQDLLALVQGQGGGVGTGVCGRGIRNGRGRGFRNVQGIPLGPVVKLGSNQCAYCKQQGHWKNECPNRPGSMSRVPNAVGNAVQTMVLGEYSNDS